MDSNISEKSLDTEDSDSYEKFEHWEMLPFELKEMISEKLDFNTWLNLMTCGVENTGNCEFPKYQPRIASFSFHSDVKREKSKEMEHIRIQLDDGFGKMMVKVEEFDGYCKLSWNLVDTQIGSVNIRRCGYLKVAEKFLGILSIYDCESFEMVVNKKKTDPSAQSVSKWPYLSTFVKRIIGFEKEFTLTLPHLDAKKVVDSINELLTEIALKREARVRALKELSYFGFYSASFIKENTIKINGPVSEYEFYRNALPKDVREMLKI